MSSQSLSIAMCLQNPTQARVEPTVVQHHEQQSTQEEKHDKVLFYNSAVVGEIHIYSVFFIN